MIVTSRALRRVVVEATSLSELIDCRSCGVDVARPYDPYLADRRLAHWCQLVAGGDWDRFRRRLRWDGLDAGAARRILGRQPCYRHGHPLPGWVGTLEEVIRAGSGYLAEDGGQDASIARGWYCGPLLDSGDPLPFEHLMLPALFVAWGKVLRRLSSPSSGLTRPPQQLLSGSGCRSLLRGLLRRLVDLSGRCLEHEFSCFRPVGHNLLNLMVGETQNGKSRACYTAFIQQNLADGLLTLYQKYPVLGRLVATSIDYWVDATAELLQRLGADIDRIEDLYQGPVRMGKVTEVQSPLADSHNQGRRVVILAFESGLRLVYKPRSVGLDSAYNQLLDWVCDRQSGGDASLLTSVGDRGDPPPPFRPLRVLERDGYGWTEYVQYSPCMSGIGVRRFYQRAGILLCLLYVMGATDCHHENLVADGEYPMLVDLEALMHPQQRTPASSTSSVGRVRPEDELLTDSVLRTALLPYPESSGKHNITCDVSGLGSTTPQPRPRALLRWRFVNTDDMYLVAEAVTKPVQRNAPILDGELLSPGDYLEELALGFERMYRFMMSHREELVAVDGPLTAFAGQRTRFIPRPTRGYGLVLRHSVAPEFLTSGVDRGIELDILASLTSQDEPDEWSVVRREIEAIEELDIPYFEAHSDSDALIGGPRGFFVEPGHTRVLDRIRNLSDSDLALQLEVIGEALHARVADSDESSPGRAGRDRAP